MHPPRSWRVARRALFLVSAKWLAATGTVIAAESSQSPSPQLARNPFRGNAALVDSGRQSFNAHCARCHGDNASQPSAEAPDLRRLNSFCRRLKDNALKDHCLSDVDTYYLESVREGKVRAGVQYMPAWKASLSEQTIWEIRSYLDSLPPAPPRTQTSVDARHDPAPGPCEAGPAGRLSASHQAVEQPDLHQIARRH